MKASNFYLWFRAPTFFAHTVAGLLIWTLFWRYYQPQQETLAEWAGKRGFMAGVYECIDSLLWFQASLLLSFTLLWLFAPGVITSP